jgi:hypothetical protein
MPDKGIARRAEALAALLILLTAAFPGAVHAQGALATYEKAHTVSQIDWLLLQANLMILQDMNLEKRDQAGIPLWKYDRAAKRITADVVVSRALGTGPTKAARLLLAIRAARAFGAAEELLPSLRPEDAEIVFYYEEWDDGVSSPRRVDFAAYRNGELTFY